MFESLEMRRLLSIGIMVQGSTMTIFGDSGDNTICISQKDNGAIRLDYDGACATWCSSNPVLTIKVEAGKGCDTIILDESLGEYSCRPITTYLNGGAGDDTFIIASVKTKDTVHGDGGKCDTVDYSWLCEGVNVSLDNVANDGACGERDNVDDTVDNIIGTDYCDYLIGSNCDNEIDGLGGNDVILGLGGCDVLYGGCGNDSIRGGCDDDYICGGDGRDTMSGDDGCDFIDALESGKQQKDYVCGGDGYDIAKVAGVDEVGSDVEKLLSI